MARNDKPTPLGIETEEMTADERAAQILREAEMRAAEIEQAAAEKMQQADMVLAEAHKTAAGLKVNTTNMTFRQEMDEAEKMSMMARSDRQFGPEVKRVTFICPVPKGGKVGDIVPVSINAYEYPLAAGTEYTLAEPIKDIAFRAVK